VKNRSKGKSASRPSAGTTRDDADRRVRRSKQVVLTTTYQLLTENGISGLSVDEVARRSGVAKTTIYRHWPSRSALLLDACSQLGAKRDAPDTGSLRGDLAVLTSDIAHRLTTARWPAVLPSIIDAAERDPELAGLHATLHSALIGAFRAVLERAHKRGEMPRKRGVSELIAAILGPMFYRRWFSREPLDKRFVNGIVDSVIGSRPRKS
jgi:AcrR family transcriptional regulator